MRTARKQEITDPQFRSRDDVKQYLYRKTARDHARYAELTLRRTAFRRVGLLSVLCFCVLQYYFLSIGLELVSMPKLLVFLPAPGPQVVRPKV